MHFVNRTPTFLVERSKNKFTTPSNREVEKVKNFRSKDLQINSNWTK